MSIWTDVEAAEQDIDRRLALRQYHPYKRRVRATPAPPVISKLNIEDYLADSAAPSSSLYRGEFPGFTDSLGNDDWGDCGDAMVIHGSEAVNAEAGNAVPPYAVGDALQGLYGPVSGFDEKAGPPGNNPTDVGTDNAKLISYVISDGVPCAATGARHKASASIAVAVGNTVAEQILIEEFVVMYRSVALPENVQGEADWYLNEGQGSSQPGSWGYHDIPYLGWRPSQDWIVDSWGQLVLAGHRWDPEYATQGFGLLYEDLLNAKTGVSATGLDYDALKADFAKL
jgi:hypothetical protein